MPERRALVFADYMVLQRRMPICIWGTCEEPEHISVCLNGREICTADLEAGEFTFQIPAQEAVEDALLEIGSIQLHHVDIGEVWVAGGQSNMEFMLQYDRDGEAEIASANDPHLRTYTVGQYSFPGEREMGYKAWNPWDRWVPFTTENAKELPAVAVYFAKELREQGVPVGILNCSWGGTTASAWMDRKLLASDPDLKVYTDEFDTMVAKLDMERFQLIRSFVRRGMASPDGQKIMAMIHKNTYHPAQLQKAMAAAMQSDASQRRPVSVPELPGGIDLTKLSQAELMQEGPGDKSEPGSLYENMVREILGYSVKGVIWYQGESDQKKASIYSKLFTAMIGCWRDNWKMKNPAQLKMPFLFVQIAPYGVWMNNTSENFPELRWQQQMVADTVADAYMASISDVGNVYDIHPKEKRPVSHRLALLARKYTYGETLSADGPRALDAEITGDTLAIRFDCAEGLHIVPQNLETYNGFPLADILPDLIPPALGNLCGLEVLADGTPLSDAVCFAEHDRLLIQSRELLHTGEIRIRFAQTPFYQVNLFNATHIPAVPFDLTAVRIE